MKLILCFLLSISCVGIANSQLIPSKNVTINEGLPSNSIKSFFKDSRGYIWIGTDAGLCRYDGKNYKVYNEANGLKYTQVWSIVEDKEHNLWLSVYGNGLAKFDGKKFTYFNERNGLINNSIRKIHYSKKHDCLILATENGLSIFNGKTFKSFKKKNGIQGFQIVGIDEFKDKIWITSSYNGVYKLSIEKQLKASKLDSLFHLKTTYSSFHLNDTCYCSGPDQILFTKRLKNGKLDSVKNPIIWNYAKAKNSIYCTAWNVTDPNGGLFEIKNNKTTNITKKANITSNGLWCNYYDEETQQLWVGSIDKGVFIVDLSNRIKQYTASYFGLKELQIQELYIDKNGSLWIGAKDYILKIKQNNQAIVISKNQLYQKLTGYFQKHTNVLSQDREYTLDYKSIGFTSCSIASDIDGYTWVSNTWGLFCFDSKMNIVHFYGSNGGHVVFDTKDRLYYGQLYSSIYRLTKKNDRTKCQEYNLGDNSVPRDITKICKQGNLIWFGTNSKGLFLLQNGKFTSLIQQQKFKEKNIKELILNSKNELIIGTNNGSVLITKWDGQKLRIIKEFKPYKDIVGTSISFIEYNDGTYFVGTNKGINILQNNHFVKLLDKSEGVEDIQFNDCVKDKNANLWIASNNGLVKLNTKSILNEINQKKAPIRINELYVNGNRYTKKLDYTWGAIPNNKIELTYKQNDIQILFSSINSFNANKNEYRYKIDGLSNGWSKFLPNGNIQLLGLTTGKYVIHIEGKNTGTGSSFQTKVITLIITPPFWKTTWFITLVLLILITLAYLIIRYRIRFIKHREREKAEVTNKLTETKLEALRAQMNPHFTFNAMNSIQNYIIDNDTTNALHYLGEFSKLIRQTLENASEKLMSLETEIRFLESYMNVQKMRFDKVTSSIKMDNSIDKYRTLIPPLILQPFIENAFEHAFEHDSDKQQTIDIYFFIDAGKLICTIRDNGTGFDEGASNSFHKSFGQKLTKDRLDLLNREFETRNFNYEITNLKTVDSNLSGTEVRITFLLLLE